MTYPSEHSNLGLSDSKTQHAESYPLSHPPALALGSRVSRAVLPRGCVDNTRRDRKLLRPHRQEVCLLWAWVQFHPSLPQAACGCPGQTTHLWEGLLFRSWPRPACVVPQCGPVEDMRWEDPGCTQICTNLGRCFYC